MRRDEALQAIENAQSRKEEIESVCTEAHHTINNLCYQVNFWEKKYQNLRDVRQITPIRMKINNVIKLWSDVQDTGHITVFDKN